jgi:hypothetical protein
MCVDLAKHAAPVAVTGTRAGSGPHAERITADRALRQVASHLSDKHERLIARRPAELTIG